MGKNDNHVYLIKYIKYKEIAMKTEVGILIAYYKNITTRNNNNNKIKLKFEKEFRI